MGTNQKTIGTCQACFGAFAIRGEAMVLHGFKRPGWGYTIGRCWGVDKKPYELDCEVTKAWRAQIAAVEIPGLAIAASAVRGAAELTKMFNDYTKPIRKGYEQKAITFTRGSAEVIKGYTFESVEKSKLANIASDVSHFERLLKELDARIAAWVYAPERLGKSERKVPLVHKGRTGLGIGTAICQISHRIGRGFNTTQENEKVTCPRCLARIAKRAAAVVSA